MTVTDQIKILDRKIMQTEAQYDLDRKAAKISALSFNNLDKYEYLTGEDLRLKPSTFEQAKFEYSPLGKFFNKGLKEDQKKEELLKRLKNIEDKNEEQLKTIEDQEEDQSKAINRNKIKPPLLKSIYSQEVKDGKNDNNEAKKKKKKRSNDYPKLVYWSGDNVYFDFNKFGPLSSFYLKFVNRNIGISVAKLNMKEFKDKINRLKKKKAKNQPYKINKKEVLDNSEALYDGLEIIIDAFERRVFEYEGRPVIDLDYDSGAYGLTTKELQMFKKLFKYDNLNKLWKALMDADKEKHDELLNNLKIKQTVLNEQIDIKTGVERRWLENLANTVEDILDSVRENRHLRVSEIPNLESE